jgi:hypothetical protein
VRLVNFRYSRPNDQLFQFTELLSKSFLGILTTATNKGVLRWQHLVRNVFSTKFHGLELAWDQLDDKSYILHIGKDHIEDDGSGAYGFVELSRAILEQKERLLQPPKDCFGRYWGSF